MGAGNDVAFNLICGGNPEPAEATQSGSSFGCALFTYTAILLC